MNQPPERESSGGPQTRQRILRTMSESSPIHVNEANESELRQLRHIGPRRAERILAWRNDVGPIADPTTFGQVAGISAGQVAQIAGLLRFSAPRAERVRRPALAAAIIVCTSVVTLGVLGTELVAAIATAAGLCTAGFAALTARFVWLREAPFDVATVLGVSNAVTAMLLVSTWLAKLPVGAQFGALAAFIAVALGAPAFSFAVYRDRALHPTVLQVAADVYAHLPLASLALAAGLLLGEADPTLAGLFACWCAVVVTVSLGERSDPAGGFVAALSSSQREDLERLRNAGLILFPRDDLRPVHLRLMRCVAGAVGAGGFATLIAGAFSGALASV